MDRIDSHVWLRADEGVMARWGMRVCDQVWERLGLLEPDVDPHHVWFRVRRRILDAMR